MEEVVKVCLLDQVRSGTSEQALLQYYSLPTCNPAWIENIFKCETFFHA